MGMSNEDFCNIGRSDLMCGQNRQGWDQGFEKVS
jgi:hypothetical protein